MKKTLIFIFLVSIFYSNLIIRFPISASENIANSIGGMVSNYLYLHDKNNEGRYILYEFVNGGYLIYDNINKSIAEYSLKNESPYKELSGDGYYFGPTLYFNNEENLNESNDKITFNDCCNLPKLISDENVKSRSLISEYRVPYSFYFEKLDGVINNFPDNINNDCGYVAASILLSYYDLFYNSDIISDMYIQSINNDSFVQNEWTKFPCANMAFKNLLRSYGQSNETVAHDILGVIDGYFVDKTNILNYVTNVRTVPVYSMICSDIYSYGPLILFGLLTSDTFSLHAFIVYGYNALSINEMMLLAHLGYNNQSEVWINMSLLGNFNLTGTTYTINFNNVPHKHGNSFLVNNHAYCISEKCHIGEYELKYTYFDSQYHYVNCLCGYSLGKEEHEFVVSLSDLAVKVAPPVMKTCKFCGVTSI